MGQVAEDGVVLEQVRQRFRVGDVVHGDKLDGGVAQRGAQDVAPDAAKPVDAHFDRHASSGKSTWLRFRSTGNSKGSGSEDARAQGGKSQTGCELRKLLDADDAVARELYEDGDRKSTRLNSSHMSIS